MTVSGPASRVLVVTCLMAIAPQAQAYIDPGTGSLIVQGIIAGLAGAAAVARLYWYRIKAFFKGGAQPPAQPTGSENKPETR
jgi:hypothetical protein